ncbi:hypothetical protein GSI_02742 [Ganoderma sinense ZZ0214-1]|uniref:F-box domain-containing protein n=1 Tax=Ganoderma sinense ZZ0214-1 TaxID=1077348 RepID=A0A2G8SMG3_9APHY|nr:hypothetical protein GSI_02742 [Ganoderma sinense ZZ0214-1]
MTTHSAPLVCSLGLGDLPSDILLLILSLLHGQHIARCVRVCRSFADLIHSDLYLQYIIALAQIGMVDGHSSSLPLPERLQRLRHYISNFRNGIFHHESIFKDPGHSRQALNIIKESVFPVYHAEDSSALYRRVHLSPGSSLFVVSHGSAQAGIESHHLMIPFRIPSPENPWRLVNKWAIDEAQDLLVTVEMECLASELQGRTTLSPPEVHFYSLSGSKSVGAAADHPAAARPHWQIALPDGTEPTTDINVLGVWVTTEHVVWEIADRGVRDYTIEVCNWRTGQITSLPGDHKMNIEQQMSLATMVMSSSSSTLQAGHFRADPSLSMVVLTYKGRGAHGALTTHLLIPLTTILAQIRRAVAPQCEGATADDSEQVPQPPPSAPTPVPWEDWGAGGCLRLRLPNGAYRMLPKPHVIPFSSRIPIVVYHDDRFRSVSIYVVDINPLAARHALATRSHGSAQATAVVEDEEGTLPGVVDPECSAIPYVVYHFPLPDVPPERPMGYRIWSVETTMTGFAISLTNRGVHDSLQSWTV